MKNFFVLLTLITLLTFPALAQTDNESTDSVKVGETTSGWFYLGWSKLLYVQTPATLDTSVVQLLTSNDTTSANFKIVTESDGDTVSFTFKASSVVLMEPLKVFGLKRYFKIKQTKIAAATRNYIIGTGKY